LVFEGEGIEEIAKVKRVENELAPKVKVGDVLVRVDESYYRPAEVSSLIGDASKAKEKLGWTPQISVEEMCSEMMKFDLQIAKKQAFLISNDFKD